MAGRLNFSPSPKIAFILGVIVTFIFGLILFWIVNNLKDAKDQSPANLFQPKKIEDVIKEVKKTVNIPDETPQVLTVSDVEKLKVQPFFADAKNGDLVLAFPKAQKALLYRVMDSKVITYQQIFIPQPSEDAKQSTSSAKKVESKPSPTNSEKPKNELVKVMILNGSKEKGLAKKAGDMLDEAVFEVIGTGNTKGDYEKTFVIDINKKAPVAKIGKLMSTFSKVKVTAQKIPEKENIPPGADVVVILGSDFSSQY